MSLSLTFLVLKLEFHTKYRFDVVIEILFERFSLVEFDSILKLCNLILASETRLLESSENVCLKWLISKLDLNYLCKGRFVVFLRGVQRKVHSVWRGIDDKVSYFDICIGIWKVQFFFQKQLLLMNNLDIQTIVTVLTFSIGMVLFKTFSKQVGDDCYSTMNSNFSLVSCISSTVW